MEGMVLYASMLLGLMHTGCVSAQLGSTLLGGLNTGGGGGSASGSFSVGTPHIKGCFEARKGLPFSLDCPLNKHDCRELLNK
jgi:hypothetical protein